MTSHRFSLPRRVWLIRSLAVLALLVFGGQLVWAAHTQTTFVDEGMYLYLGYHFVTGDLSYSSLGAWNYYAPLAYFLPGVVQFLFGPGLAPGRSFSIACALLAALAVWIVARRLRGEGWAAVSLWALALMPMQIDMYSLALSQSLAACLLTWTLVLAIGEQRSPRQILGAGLLAGLTVMTRHNLAFLIPALVGYVYYQHGRRQALLALLSAVLPVLAGMILFWPSSLRLWIPFWLPGQWFPFLNRFGPPPDTQSVWSSSTFLIGRFAAFFMGLRAHFLTLGGALATLLLWPRRWTSPFHRRTALFLAGFFFASLALHAWVTLGGAQCVFCFAPYIAFFSNAALLLVVTTLPDWERRPSPARGISILFFLLLMALSPAYIDGIGDRLLALQLPRFSNGLHLGEWATLWSYLHHWFPADYPVMRQILPPVFFLTSVLLTLGVLVLLYLRLRRVQGISSYAFPAIALRVALASGFLFSPTLLNTPTRSAEECNVDTLAYFDQLGKQLATLIPPGSRVYWQVQSAVPLLSLPNVKVPPAQVYSLYTYRLGGDATEVEALGYWNIDLARQWATQADFLVIEFDFDFPPIGPDSLPEPANLLDTLPPLNPCMEETTLLVYQTAP